MKKAVEVETTGKALVTTLDETLKTKGELELKDQTHAKAIRKVADEIIKATVKTGRLYFDLCMYIRKNQISPKLVSFELSELGFNRVRISEINRVAQAADDVWNEFEAQTIGFRKTLEMTRGNVIQMLAEENSLTETDVKAQLAEQNANEEVLEKASPEEKAERRLSVGAHAMLLAAPLLDTRKRTFSIGNGYTVIISKDKTGKPIKKTLASAEKSA